MTSHKFAVGDRVTYMPGRFDGNVRPGVYTIVRLLPITVTGCQYRAKSALDVHERVINEAQLHLA